MLNVENLLWYIEKELASELDLARIARHYQLSPFALSRLFAMSTGWPVMRYVRARRLSKAAQALQGGQRDILSVALDAGYASHEAFTRAFSELFAMTPRQVRDQSPSNLPLVEPLRMKTLQFTTLAEPRFETRDAFFIAGMGDRFSVDKNEGIVGLWQAFVPYAGRVPGQQGGESYGLCCNPGLDGSFEYIAGVQVGHLNDLPPGFACFHVPRQHYAVFRHQGHVSTIYQTFLTIFKQWLPASGYLPADGPEFEQYSADFDPCAGRGFVEVWVPVTQP